MEYLIIEILKWFAWIYLLLGVFIALLLTSVEPTIKSLWEERSPVLIGVYPMIVVGWGFFLYIGVKNER